jgi:hypothetical protein
MARTRSEATGDTGAGSGRGLAVAARGALLSIGKERAWQPGDHKLTAADRRRAARSHRGVVESRDTDPRRAAAPAGSDDGVARRSGPAWS